jgi:hypothetical protein
LTYDLPSSAFSLDGIQKELDVLGRNTDFGSGSRPWYLSRGDGYVYSQGSAILQID